MTRKLKKPPVTRVNDAVLTQQPPPATIATEPPVRRKTDDQRKENQLHIRVTDVQKAAMTKAAAKEGLELSPWVRATLLKAAGLLPT